MKYDVVCTAVSDRADLFVRSMESLLRNVDPQPAAIIVHEDDRGVTVPEGAPAGTIERWLSSAKAEGRIQGYAHRLQNPAVGMGKAVVWTMEAAAQRAAEGHIGPYVLFTQEDWEILRPLPLRRCAAIMDAYGLHHVRFNKRKTMRAKHEDTDHPWYKVPIEFDVPLEGCGSQPGWAGPPGDDPWTRPTQVLCISDHWYTQTSLWRLDKALPNLRAAAAGKSQSNAFAGEFNHRMNLEFGAHAPNLGWGVQDPMYRHEYLKTYIYGPMGEPRFVQHLGSLRGTGNIVDHFLER